jgi:hypothetical protein
MGKDETRERILKAFQGSHDLWRTLGGIIRASGLSEEAALAFIEQHPEEFHVSPTSPGGEPLYSVIEDAPTTDAFGFRGPTIISVIKEQIQETRRLNEQLARLLDYLEQSTRFPTGVITD